MSSKEGKSDGSLMSLDEVEEQHIRHVLSNVDGNRSKAFAILKISRVTLIAKNEKI